jgi:hypothetical protein
MHAFPTVVKRAQFQDWGLESTPRNTKQTTYQDTTNRLMLPIYNTCHMGHIWGPQECGTTTKGVIGAAAFLLKEQIQLSGIKTVASLPSKTEAFNAGTDFGRIL